MPLYPFKCESCGRTQEEVRRIADRNESCVCTCGNAMQRTFEVGNIDAANKEYGNTRYSDSLAVSIDQIEEHKRKFPDIRIDAEGRPGFDTVQQHDNYLKACGFEKVPQRVRK
jgi:putative FmdB family regulatory protein